MSKAPPTTHAYEPDLVYPAGTHLSEWLERKSMSQAEFARRVGLSNKHVNQIVNGGAGITPDVAVAFENVTSLPARFWMRLEANHRAAEARRQDDVALEASVDILDSFPIKEMERRNYFPEIAHTKVGKLRALLRFFGVANVRALETVALRPAALRPSKAFKPNEAALAAWLRRAEIRAAAQRTEPFDPERCTDALQDLRSYTCLPGTSWIDALIERCAEVGIAVVIEPELPGCRINGATRWLGSGRAMVALSLRHRRHDIVWFTVFHEFGHLLRHSKRETFIDAEGMGVPEELERDADRFASRLLIPPEHENELRSLATEKDVLAFAKSLGVSPAIVVGRMQHEHLIPHNRWTHLIPRYQFSDDR